MNRTDKEDRENSVAFPAYAGMNRLPGWHRRSSARVPRVCGDEPPGGGGAPIDPERSPRMRG